MINIYPASHKIIASCLASEFRKIYGVNLDETMIKWGSIAPDYLPYYKLKRHYIEESLPFIAKEICSLILVYRCLNIQKLRPGLLKYFSKKIGVISHYLSDYTCYPHMKRQTFYSNFKEHVIYEKNLEKFSISYRPKKIELSSNIIDYTSSESRMLDQIMNLINDIVEEYKNSNHSYANDLDYAYSLSLTIGDYIMQNILYCSLGNLAMAG